MKSNKGRYRKFMSAGCDDILLVQLYGRGCSFGWTFSEETACGSLDDASVQNSDRWSDAV